MRHLHYVEIENFKRFGNTQRIELDHPAVLIGPNNSGKTSAIQALALWSLAVKTWVQESEVSDAFADTATMLIAFRRRTERFGSAGLVAFADTYQQRVNSRLISCHTCRNRRVERNPQFFFCGSCRHRLMRRVPHKQSDTEAGGTMLIAARHEEMAYFVMQWTDKTRRDERAGGREDALNVDCTARRFFTCSARYAQSRFPS